MGYGEIQIQRSVYSVTMHFVAKIMYHQ